MKVIHKKVSYSHGYSLKFNREGDLIVRTNKITSNLEVEKILERHKVWIDKNFLKVQREQSSRKKLEIFDGNKISILGIEYKFHFNKTIHKIPKFHFNAEEIIVAAFEFHETEIKKEFVKFLRKFALKLFEDKVAFYCEQYKVECKKVVVKTQKTKWGSCSNKKNINLNIRLLFCPEDVLDYVVIHEVCHLLEMNHSKSFWDLVQVECPDYKIKRKWLREKGSEIVEV